jgi:hypothetical protein
LERLELLKSWQTGVGRSSDRLTPLRLEGARPAGRHSRADRPLVLSGGVSW